MATTKVDFTEYKNRKVGLLPVAVRSPQDKEVLDFGQVADGVAESLRDDAGVPISRIAPNEVIDDDMSFPLTYSKIRAIGSKLKLDAVVGVSVSAISVSKRSPTKVNAIVVFADVADVKKRWVITGTWNLLTTDQIAQFVKLELQLLLSDLHIWVRYHIKPAFAELGSPNDPILTFYSPNSNTPRLEQTTDLKSLDLVITAFDDDGIKRVSVTNKGTGILWSTEPSGSDPTNAPLYISTPVTIPLAFGPNDIAIIAEDGLSNKVTRRISLKSTSVRGPVVLAIGVEKYAQQQDAVGAAKAAKVISAAARARGSRTAALLTDDDATLRRAYKAFFHARSEMGPGDQLVTYFAGRASVSGGAVNIDLYDALDHNSNGFESGAGLVRLDNLDILAGFDSDVLLLDLCADPAREELVRSAIAQSDLSRNSRVLISLSSCSDGVGKLADAAAFWLIDEARHVPNRKYSVDGLLDTLRFAVPTRVAPDTSKEYQVSYVLAPGFKDDATSASDRGDVKNSDYFAIGASVKTLSDAKKEAEGFRLKGYPSKIVLTPGDVYGVSIGEYSTRAAAAAQIEKAQVEKQVSADAYILPPQRVRAIVEPP
jgi:hypothetical protein